MFKKIFDNTSGSNTKTDSNNAVAVEPKIKEQKISSMGNKPELKIISFSGEEGATGNMTVYECGEDIIIVDVGISFPDDTLPGVDVVIPDFRYILENQHKVRGIVITHAHEDHIGAIPYLFKEIQFPIYSSKIVHEFLKERIKDKASKQILEKTSFHLLDETTEEVTLGNFKVSAFGVNHSVPNALGISINTPQGRVVHMADFKVDYEPVLDKVIDLETMKKYGDDGVLCLLSDCLGSDHKGKSEPESSMNNTFRNLFAEAGDKQIMVSLISSNIARMNQIITAAVESDRKVVLAGRSIGNSVRIARSLGYIDFSDDVFVSEKNSQDYHQKDLVYIVAGCFGQQGSGADRISRGEHKHILVDPECRFILSSKPGPPGSRGPMEALRDRFILAGAEVIYPEIYENLHISGHGLSEDLTIAAKALRPKYFIPIGGSVSQMRNYTNLIVGPAGFNKENVFELLEGENVIFSHDNARMGKRLDTQQVLVDGNRIGVIGQVVIRDRDQLSEDGLFVVVVPMSKNNKEILGGVDIITRGFIYVKESKELMGKAKDLVNKLIDKHDANKPWSILQNQIEKDVGKYLYKQTGSKPMIIVHGIYINN